MPHLRVVCVIGHAGIALRLVMVRSVIGKHLQQEQHSLHAALQSRCLPYGQLQCESVAM